MKRVHHYFPNMKALSINDYIISKQDRAGGDLAQMIRLQNVLSEQVQVLKPKFSSRVCLYQNTANEGKAFFRRIFFETRLVDQPRVVIFHDSFIWGMLKFLKETFHRTVLAHHCGLKFDTGLIEREKPDIVIYQFIERVAKVKIKDPFKSCGNP